MTVKQNKSGMTVKQNKPGMTDAKVKSDGIRRRRHATPGQGESPSGEGGRRNLMPSDRFPNKSGMTAIYFR